MIYSPKGALFFLSISSIFALLNRDALRSLMKSAIQLLTEREKEVLQLLATGMTYEKISDRLTVSPETVKMHLKNIYRKLKVQNKIEALNKVKLL